jgi:hypothetical protein
MIPMRQIGVFIFLLLLSLSGMAQVRPEAFIGLLPAIPSDICGMSKTHQLGSFTAQNLAGWALEV